MKVKKYQRTDNSVFIAIEGIDGCGKDTIAKYLAEYLQKSSKVLVTSEPRYEQEGTLIRKLIGNKEVDNTRLFFIYTADRCDHILSEVFPALRNGKAVITIRYIYSSFVYQQDSIGEQGLTLDTMLEMSEFLPCADLGIVLDIPVEEALKRISWRKIQQDDFTSHEKFEYREMLTKLKERYLQLAKDLRFPELVVVDGMGTEEEVAQRVIQLYESYLKTRSEP